MGGRSWLIVVGSAVIGFSAGWLLGTAPGAALGAAVGGIFGAVGAYLQLRASVTFALVASMAIGAVIGQGIVHALCLPETCVAAETVGAIVTAVAAVIAVGLVVALVTRSFEEYHEAVEARRPPPEPGCETDQAT